MRESGGELSTRLRSCLERGGFLVLAALLIPKFSFGVPEPLKVSAACAALVFGFAEFSERPVPEESPAPQAALLAAHVARAIPAAPASSPDEILIDMASVDRALDGIEYLFAAVYGDKYQREALPANSEAMTKELRSVLQLFQIAGRATIPRQVLLGIEERVSQKTKKIKDLKTKIGNLRADLGPKAEYLTPASLAALDIFREIGRSRNLSGGGVRESLKLVARPVRENLDEMFHIYSSSAQFDDALRDLLINATKLVKAGLWRPQDDPELRAALEDLIVSCFAITEQTIKPETFQTFRRYTAKDNFVATGYRRVRGRSNARLIPDERKNLSELVSRLENWQIRLLSAVENFAKTYYRGRIAFNILSLMTRPNGYHGIPLGSPLRDTFNTLEDHPYVLRLALNAYHNKTQYLSLSLGQMMQTEAGPRQLMQQERGMTRTDRFLYGYLVTDDRLYAAFQRGFEYELEETAKLLSLVKHGRTLGMLSRVVGQFSGGFTRYALSQAKVVRGIVPGKFIDTLVQQAETGTLAGEDGAPLKVRTRQVQVLPSNLPAWMVDSPAYTPWLKATREILKTPEILDPHPHKTTEKDSAKDERERRARNRQRKQQQQQKAPSDDETDEPKADDDETAQPEQKQVAKEEDDTEEAEVADDDLEERDEIEISPSNTGEVDRFFWGLLEALEDRAIKLLDEDTSLQLAAEKGNSIDQTKVRALANKIQQLLKITMRRQAELEAAFRANGLSMEDAEETFAWHLLKVAPTLAMYIVIGPPGPPRINPPVLTGQAGLAWRVVMLAPRMAYGDGTADEGIQRDTSTVPDPVGLLKGHRREIMVAVLTVASTVGLSKGLPWVFHKLGWGSEAPAAAVSAEEPKPSVKKDKAKESPVEEKKAKPKSDDD